MSSILYTCECKCHNSVVENQTGDKDTQVNLIHTNETDSLILRCDECQRYVDNAIIEAMIEASIKKFDAMSLPEQLDEWDDDVINNTRFVHNMDFYPSPYACYHRILCPAHGNLVKVLYKMCTICSSHVIKCNKCDQLALYDPCYMRPLCLSCKKNQSHLLIGITGKVGSGKSTTAGFLVDDCMLEYSFASPLKEIAKIIGFDHDQVYGTQEQKLEINKFWGISGRQFLQVFGSEVCRDYLPKVLPDMRFESKTLWIKLFEKYYDDSRENDLVISDVRFSDEAKSIREHGGYIVKIVRDDNMQTNDEKADNKQVTNTESNGDKSVCQNQTTTLNTLHKSETEMNNIKTHFVIRNNGTKGNLRRKLREVIKSIDSGYADISNVTIYL